MTDKKEALVGGFFVVTERPLTADMSLKVAGSFAMTRFILQVRPIAEGAETRVAREEIKAAQSGGLILPGGMKQ